MRSHMDEFHPPAFLYKEAEWGFEGSSICSAGIVHKDGLLTLKLIIFCYVCSKHAVPYHGIIEVDNNFRQGKESVARSECWKRLIIHISQPEFLLNVYCPSEMLFRNTSWLYDVSSTVLIGKKNVSVNSLWEDQGRLLALKWTNFHTNFQMWLYFFICLFCFVFKKA